MLQRGHRAPRQHPHRVLQGAARRLRPGARRRRDREGPARRLRLRLRAADGADEPAALGDRHVLPLDQPAVLVPVVEPGAGGRALRRRRVGMVPKHVQRPSARAVPRRDGRRDACSRTSPTRYPTPRLLLVQLQEMLESARELPLSASVSVNRDEFGELLAGRDRRAARGAARGALAPEGARARPRAGGARSGPAHRSGAGAGRADGREERGRPRGPPRPPRRSSRTPTARRPRSATRPRTTSTASSPRSRSCSTARCSRCKRVASGSRCTSASEALER